MYVPGTGLPGSEALRLMMTTGRDVLAITATADEIRGEKAGDVVTYVRNQNLHLTNICKNLCGFCGFGGVRVQRAGKTC
jgi:FO synthase subunit 2